MSVTSTRAFAVTFAKPCAGCGGLKGEGVYGYANGHVVTDTWTCACCGRVVYAWTWESSMLAAQEARAAWDARTLGEVQEASAPSGDPNAPLSAENGQPSKPDRPRGQMEMWD